MAVRFETSKDAKGEFHFKLLNDDGKTLLRSEGYKAMASCEGGIESVRKNSTDDSHYDVKTASDGRPYFNLKSGNGQVVGTSPMFADEAACKAAMAAVRAGAAGAAVSEA